MPIRQLVIKALGGGEKKPKGKFFTQDDIDKTIVEARAIEKENLYKDFDAASLFVEPEEDSGFIKYLPSIIAGATFVLAIIILIKK